MQRLYLADFLAPGDACHAARTTFRPGSPKSDLHDHDFHELFWVEAGAIRHRTLAGEEILTAGRLVFVRPRDAHAVSASDELGTIINIAFLSKAWRSLVARYGEPDPLFGPSVRHHQLRASQFHHIHAAATDFIAGVRSQLSLDSFLLCVLRVMKNPDDAEGASVPAWLEQAVANLSEPAFAARGVIAIVDAAGRSPEHVARTCRSVYGKSPTDLVTEARLGHAATALAATDHGIIQIAADCGFEALSHFYACFAARYGSPPATWRRRQQRIVRPRR